MEPETVDVDDVSDVIQKSGDVLRLSDIDKNLVALAFRLKRIHLKPQVVTDDYSMQNVLKIVGIPYKSVLTDGIKEIYGWVKICKGCKKHYPPDYAFDECEIVVLALLKKGLNLVEYITKLDYFDLIYILCYKKCILKYTIFFYR